MNPVQQRINQGCEDKLFTSASPLDLLQQLAAEVKVVAAQWRRDRWFFLGSKRSLTHSALPRDSRWSHPQKAGWQARAKRKQIVIGSHIVVTRRALALSAQMRIRVDS